MWTIVEVEYGGSDEVAGEREEEEVDNETLLLIDIPLSLVSQLPYILQRRVCVCV